MKNKLTKGHKNKNNTSQKEQVDTKNNKEAARKKRTKSTDLLWASLYLPDLLLDTLEKDNHNNAACNDSNAIAITERVKNRQQVRSCDNKAQQAGIHHGMALNSAYALLPALSVVEYDEEHEARLLQQIGEWAMQFSSVVCLHPPNHILIEIAGSKRLFEGFDTLIALIQQELHKFGFNGQIGIAPTPLAANLLARANIRRGIVQKTRLPNTISELPVSMLELPADTIKSLQRSGIRQISGVLNVSPSSLTRRFGPSFVNYLDRLLGNHPDPRTPLRLRDYFERSLDLLLDAHDTNALQFSTQRMINELADFLIARDCGINQFIFTLRHQRHADTTLQLQFLQATSQAKHLHKVLSEQLSRTTLPAPVCSLHLISDAFSEIERDAADFFVKSRQQQKSLGEVIDTLSSRLGKNSLYTLSSVDDHRPEKAWKKSSPDNSEEVSTQWPERPLWLLEEPRAVSADLYRRLSIESDAERIETGWWETEDVRRDYFMVCDQRGTRYWAYKKRNDNNNTLFIHGVFA